MPPDQQVPDAALLRSTRRRLMAWSGGLTLLLLVVPFLLPHMRERYFFAGEVFLFVAAWATGRLVWAATGMLGLSMLANLASLALIAPINQAFLSVVVLAVLVAVALPLLTRSGGRPHLRDEPPAEWPAVPR